MSDYLGGTRVYELWSKIKERLSKKQDVLTGAPGQLIGIGDDGTTQATVYPRNSNLLDNWYFLGPINQRGEDEYETGYTIDRWSITIPSGATPTDRRVTISSGRGITITPGIYIKQVLENHAIPIGATVTLSAIINNELLSGTQTWEGEAGKTFASKSGWKISGLPSINWIQIFNESGSPEDLVVAAKLELGPIQTLAHKEGDTWVLNDPPPNYALELAKCQRYQVVLKSSVSSEISGGANYIGTGFVASNTQARILLPLPQTLNKNPTVTHINALLSMFKDGENYEKKVESMQVAWGYVANSVSLLCNMGEGVVLEPGNPCALRLAADSKIIINANL